MPTFEECSQRAGGSLSRDLYDAIRNDPNPTQALKQRQAQIALQKRQKGLQAIALHAREQEMRKHSKGVDTGLASILGRDIWGEGTSRSIDFRSRAIMAEAFADWSEGLSRFRSKAAGLVQDQEGLRDMVRALFGQQVEDGNVAKLAGLWSDVAEKLRERFNRAGGAIGKLDDWGLPQFHDAKRVHQYGDRQAWKDAIVPLLDRSKMLNDDGKPISDIEFETALDAAHARIVTDGLVDLKPGVNGGKKLANKRADHRFFVFKDGDAWLKYHDQFGRQDIYTTLTDHLMGMSHDIAMLETLGPNPEAGFRYLRDIVKKEFAPGGDNEAKGAKYVRQQYLDALWNVVSGKVAHSPNPNIADFANSTRHLLVAAKLGGAFLSALSDLTFQAMTRKFNGLPAMKMVNQMVKQMTPGNEADRAFAVKLGLGADAWLNHSMVANRFSDVYGANFASKVSDFTMRASLLSSWTDAGRKAFGLEMTNFMAEHRALAWRDFDRTKPLRAFRRALKRGGITPDEWDTFRKLQPMEYKGVEYLRPQDLVEQAGKLGLSERAADDLTAKVLGVIHEEMDFAVPSPDARVRAITTWGQASGTAAGEVARGVMQFKSFPITVILTHINRAIAQEGFANRASYFATAFIATTVLGALALQAKEISRGKDPRPMDDPKFMMAAMWQGGGMGILGDFLFSEESRFGHGLGSTLLGPTGGLLADTYSLTVDNMKRAGLSDKDPNFGQDMVSFTERYLPGSSIWYARLALERLVFDQLDALADNGRARKAWRRTMNMRRRDYQQGYWWEPGDTAPKRAPDFENVGGN